MHIANLTAIQIARLAEAATRAQYGEYTFRLAFDSIDNSIKYKVGEFVWSPPIATEER